jgi:hypothetical protein
MKTLMILAAIALFAVNAVAWASPATPAKATDTAAQPVVMMAEQELPFDRYWSTN